MGCITEAAETGHIRSCSILKRHIEDAGLWSVPGDSGHRRTHMLPAEPFVLSHEEFYQLEQLGSALLAFYKAVNVLYLRSEHDWARQYLDVGKGEDIIRHSGMKYQRRSVPGIIRPDILITQDGFAITELDSVPGGFGHLDCLSAALDESGWDLIGSGRGMRDGFATMLRDSAVSEDPVCAIVVSDESIDYLAEMQYMAAELRKGGLRAFTVRPRDISFSEEGLYIDPEGERLRVDVLYRFYELFDLLNIPKAELISYAARKKTVVVTPPYKHYLEEKCLLALLHSETLKDFWLGHLGEDNYALLMRTVVPTWIMDSRPVPPHAHISGFKWRGSPVRDWREIASGTQKERALVVKPSGFSPLSWGARGVKVGHDMPESEWAEAVEGALGAFNSCPHVLQPFRDTKLFTVSYYESNCGEMREMSARVRLCPYYFVTGDDARLSGVLATACPKDKKLIHGMVDAVMAPCRVG